MDTHFGEAASVFSAVVSGSLGEPGRIAATPLNIDAQDAPAHKLKAGQRLQLSTGRERYVFELTHGVAYISAALHRDRPQIPCILFPGDTAAPSSLPFVQNSSLVMASKLGTVREWTAGDRSAPGTDLILFAEMTYNAARATLQSAILANLTSEERVATLLTEFAIRCGRSIADGCIFEMPLSRPDVALYLGLNSDTVSRCVSALKSQGLIKTHGRSIISCSNVAALMARSPVTEVLKRVLRQKTRLGTTLPLTSPS